MFTLAVDVMGGDLGPRVALKACKKLLRQRSDVRLIISILQDQLDQAHSVLQHYSHRVQLIGCEQQIDMSDKPSQVLRQSKNSTMAVAINEVAAGRAQGIISAGNTGVLMALSKHLLSMHQGISRPALATLLPTRGKPLLLLDLGANLNVSNEQLLQFAALGVSWCRLHNAHEPKVGLLNVGKEATKGTERLQEADGSFKQTLANNYAGFCEGHDLFSGKLDVVVTDGFVGNLVLKASEGLSELLIDELNSQFKHHWFRRWFRLLWTAPLREIIRKISPAYNGGALLMGINGVVVKTHGNSDVRTFNHALHYVLEQIEHYDGLAIQTSLNAILQPH